MPTTTRYNIGQAANAAGMSAKRLRHYEAIGLVPAAPRTAGDYPSDGEWDGQTLRFLHRARISCDSKSARSKNTTQEPRTKFDHLHADLANSAAVSVAAG